MNNAVTLYRDKPLTVEDFRKLDELAEKSFSIKPRFVSKSVPVKDYNGEVYKWEHDVQEVGIEIFRKGDVDPRLLESLLRPVSPSAVPVHLARLAVHKRFMLGDSGWAVFVSDAVKFLGDLSEYALCRYVEKKILDNGSQFFPQLSDIAAGVREIHDRLQYAARAEAENRPAPKPQPSAPAPTHAKTAKSRRRVSRLVRLASKAPANMTLWEKRFMEAMKKSA